MLLAVGTSMNYSPPRIAVVGGGPAGLTAAFRLQRAGAAVHVFESQPWVGGRTRTDTVDGYRIDPAAQLFGSMYTALLQVLREAGAGSLLVETPGRDAIWRGRRAHEVVYGSTARMLTTSAVPLTLKLRLGAKYLPFLTQHAERLDMHALERAAPLDRESIATWGERELGRDFVNYLVFPLLAAGYGDTPEQTSAALYHMMARYGMGASLYALRGGAGGFCEAVANRLREAGAAARTSTHVERVTVGAGGVEVEGEGWTETFNGAVVATPAPAARTLLRGEAGGAGEALGKVRYRPHVALALLLDRPAGVDYFGLSFPPGEAEAAAVACVAENKDHTLVPARRGIVVVFPSPHLTPRLLEASAQAVAEALLPDLTRALPHLPHSIVRAKVYRWAEGVTVFYPGYLEHLRRFRANRDGDAPLVLAGDYLYAPTVEGAVVSGMAAAERLLRRLDASLAFQREGGAAR